MICERCGNLTEDCECDKDKQQQSDGEFAESMGDDERVWGYDGDCL